MSWWEKFLDETISRTTLFVVLFTAVIALVKLTPEQTRAFEILMGSALLASGTKSVANAIKTKAIMSQPDPKEPQ